MSARGLGASRRLRATLGVLLILATAGLTVLRVRAAEEPLATLDRVSQLHREGRAGDAVLANAQYHAARARQRLDERWSLSGHATQGALGGLLGLTLLLHALLSRRRD